LRESFKNLAFPDFSAEELNKCIIELVKLDRDWCPKKPMHSLYIRPTGISMENTLGVRSANSVKLFVILSPVGPYYP
jgi:branched-chain amino acid aminotransferase